MPELLRIFGLRFFFYSNDHLPPHIHVGNADGEARFTITPVKCIENNGLKIKTFKLMSLIFYAGKNIRISKNRSG